MSFKLLSIYLPFFLFAAELIRVPKSELPVEFGLLVDALLFEGGVGGSLGSSSSVLLGAVLVPESVLLGAVLVPESVLLGAVLVPESVLLGAVLVPESVLLGAVPVPESVLLGAVPVPESVLLGVVLVPESPVIPPNKPKNSSQMLVSLDFGVILPSCISLALCNIFNC